MPDTLEEVRFGVIVPGQFYTELDAALFDPPIDVMVGRAQDTDGPDVWEDLVSVTAVRDIIFGLNQHMIAFSENTTLDIATLKRHGLGPFSGNCRPEACDGDPWASTREIWTKPIVAVHADVRLGDESNPDTRRETVSVALGAVAAAIRDPEEFFPLPHTDPQETTDVGRTRILVDRGVNTIHGHVYAPDLIDKWAAIVA